MVVGGGRHAAVGQDSGQQGLGAAVGHRVPEHTLVKHAPQDGDPATPVPTVVGNDVAELGDGDQPVGQPLLHRPRHEVGAYDGTEVDERPHARRERHAGVVGDVTRAQVEGAVDDDPDQRAPNRSGPADLEHRRAVAMPTPQPQRGTMGDRSALAEGQDGGEQRLLPAGEMRAVAEHPRAHPHPLTHPQPMLDLPRGQPGAQRLAAGDEPVLSRDGRVDLLVSINHNQCG